MVYLYDACDQISDFCHQVTEKNAMKNILDGRTDRGKTVYPPPPSGSGGIIMEKLENTQSRVRCIRSMCRSFWPLILKQTVILTAMSNYFLSYMQIIGQRPTPNGNPATPHQPSCTVSRQHNWTDCRRLGLMLCSRSLLF